MAASRKDSSASRGPLIEEQCHLSAKTSDNQCALHGETGSLQAATISQPEGEPAKSAVQQADNCAASRRTRTRPRKDRAVSLWPLAKPTLDEGSSFGDCEDILSPHLTAGRAARQQRQSLREALAEVSSMSQQTNCQHKRPFGQPFEHPNSGWIYNATGHEKFDPRSAGSLKGESLFFLSFLLDLNVDAYGARTQLLQLLLLLLIPGASSKFAA